MCSFFFQFFRFPIWILSSNLRKQCRMEKLNSFSTDGVYDQPRILLAQIHDSYLISICSVVFFYHHNPQAVIISISFENCIIFDFEYGK